MAPAPQRGQRDMADRNRTKNAGNITELPNRAAISEEAAAWLVRIDGGELSQTEIQQLREWADRSALHRDCLQKLAADWDAMGAMQVLAEVFPLSDSEPRQGDTVGSGRGWRARFKAGWRLPIPAVAAAAMLMVLVVWLSGLPGFWRTAEFATAVGEQASHTLVDGTVVTLNTNSRLAVDYSDERRTVTLIQGEATFDVAKNPERPFVVHAGGGMAWAVGTTVTEGQVKVFSNTRSKAPAGLEVDVGTKPRADETSSEQPEVETEALIGAGETLRYSHVIRSVTPIPDEELTRKLAWRHGSLIFKGESLEEAIAEIARYTDREIVIADPALRQLRVGGHYKTDDIDTLFAALEQGFGIHVEHADNQRIVLTSSRL